MEKELQITADGSHTLYIPAMDEHYHSVNGALQESRHIFIEAGLHALEKDFIRIVEIGFGRAERLLDIEGCRAISSTSY